MSLIAFVFPGQGSQTVGMGKDLFEKFDSAKKIYAQADELMEMHLSKISFEGPSEILKETQITQPALFVQPISGNIGKASSLGANPRNKQKMVGYNFPDTGKHFGTGSTNYVHHIVFVAPFLRLLQYPFE